MLIQTSRDKFFSLIYLRHKLYNGSHLSAHCYGILWAIQEHIAGNWMRTGIVSSRQKLILNSQTTMVSDEVKKQGTNSLWNLSNPLRIWYQSREWAVCHLLMKLEDRWSIIHPEREEWTWIGNIGVVSIKWKIKT